MMRKACLYVEDYLLGNKIFEEGAFRDHVFDRFVVLKRELSAIGWNLSTQDVNTVDESDVVLYGTNMPKQLPSKRDTYKSHLIISESPFIRPDNYDKKKHRCFNKVFTWHDELVGGEKYIKLNYAHRFPKSIPRSFDKKLCHLISANKKPPFSGYEELYSKRVEVVRWFEKNHPADFDLYGVGWLDIPFSSKRVTKLISKIPGLKSMLRWLNPVVYSSYRGVVESKFETSKNYKFSICFENVYGIPGYVSEKIFDAFFAGCVPVYLGERDISKYVPSECFVDFRDFNDMNALYDYMSSMSREMYMGYLEAISSYLEGAESLPFRSDGFVKTIIESVFEAKK